MSTEDEKYARQIELKRNAVMRAQVAYSRGDATCDAVNKANQELVEAHAYWQRCRDGRVPEGRDK